MSATLAHGISLPSFRTLGYAALWCAMATSGIVFIEPAPFDFAMMGLAGAFFVTGLRLPRHIAPLMFLLVFWVLGGLMAIPKTAFFGETTQFVAVTGYLSVTAMFLACLVHREPERALPVLMSGYTAAAVIASAAGLIGYFNIVDGTYDLFTLYGRVRGPFKDPNVFAPFLIPAALFYLLYLFTKPLRGLTLYLPAFGLLCFAIFLSFSRGAWLHLILSAIFFVGFMLMTTRTPRFVGRLLTMSVLAIFAGGLLIIVALNVEQISSLLTERAKLVQSYDSGGHGRFDAQLKALSIIIGSPAGIGARDFSAIWGEEAHNVYLSVFMGSGWLGGLAYVSLVLATIARGVVASTRSGTCQGIAAVVTASFLGLAIEGLIVDTDHWRHFFILVGLIWGLPLSRFNGQPSPHHLAT